MKNIKSHFVFNKQERNGIFLLVIIIVVLQGVYFYLNFRTTEPAPIFENENQALKVQQQIDSLKRIASEENRPQIFPFNPNYITDYKGYSLGMSTTEIDRLLNHRKNDKWVNSAKEFQQVTGVSDSLLAVMSPYFKFPGFLNKKEASFSKTKNENSEIREKRDLNTATAEDLQQVNGVGEVLSLRIVNYRNKIGGFRDNIQLKDVYGLKPDVVERISGIFKIEKSGNVDKININEATVLQLSEIPYFNYEMAREIVNYRLLREKITSFEELTKIQDFPSEKIDRIKLYLNLN